MRGHRRLRGSNMQRERAHVAGGSTESTEKRFVLTPLREVARSVTDEVKYDSNMLTSMMLPSSR